MPVAGFSSGYSSAEEHYEQPIKSNPSKCALLILSNKIKNGWLVGRAGPFLICQAKSENFDYLFFVFSRFYPVCGWTRLWHLGRVSLSRYCMFKPSNMNNHSFSPAVVMRSCVCVAAQALVMLYWWLGTAWYSLTSRLSLINVFLLSRYSTLSVCVVITLNMWP